MDVDSEEGVFPPTSCRHPKRRFVYEARKTNRKRQRNQFWWLEKKRGTSPATYNPPDAIETPETSEGESPPNERIPTQSETQKGTVELDLQEYNPNKPHLNTFTPS